LTVRFEPTPDDPGSLRGHPVWQSMNSILLKTGEEVRGRSILLKTGEEVRGRSLLLKQEKKSGAARFC
jgi:hypothetical protein